MTPGLVQMEKIGILEHYQYAILQFKMANHGKETSAEAEVKILNLHSQLKPTLRLSFSMLMITFLMVQLSTTIG